MLTSGVFNRNYSADYVVNIPEGSVMLAAGPTSKSALYRQLTLFALTDGCTLTAVPGSKSFFSLPSKSL
jgi:hypothetical protein